VKRLPLFVLSAAAALSCSAAPERPALAPPSPPATSVAVVTAPSPPPPAAIAAEPPPPEAPPAPESPAESEAPAEEAWCPADVETLPGPICASVPDTLPEEGPRTLVIFLHGVTNVGSGWQLATIRGMANYGKEFKFALIAPRGILREASEDKDAAYAWPNAALSRQQTESDVLKSWADARTTLETRAGKKFDRVFVFGFSSGAYYASSLALRGKPVADGFAVFAGGGAPYSQAMLANVRHRPPVFVGYGLKDKSAIKDARKLAAALRAARWKHREMAVPKAGHTITTAEFREAITWLGKSASSAAAPAAAASRPKASETARPHHHAPAHKGKKRRAAAH